MNVTITILAAIPWTQQFSRLASQTNLRPAFSGSPPMTGFRQRTGFSMPTVLVKCGDFDPIPLCSISTWKNRCSAEPLHQLQIDYTPAFLQMQQEFCAASGCRIQPPVPHDFPSHTQSRSIALRLLAYHILSSFPARMPFSLANTFRWSTWWGASWAMARSIRSFMALSFTSSSSRQQSEPRQPMKPDTLGS